MWMDVLIAVSVFSFGIMRILNSCWQPPLIRFITYLVSTNWRMEEQDINLSLVDGHRAD